LKKDFTKLKKKIKKATSWHVVHN